jgi:hypothetical protein
MSLNRPESAWFWVGCLLLAASIGLLLAGMNVPEHSRRIWLLGGGVGTGLLAMAALLAGRMADKDK